MGNRTGVAAMIRTPASYPFPGSFAAVIDMDLPEVDRRAELVRIVRTGPGTATVAFPLRPSVASGHRTIPFAELMDGTPLTPIEARELADLQRELRGRKIDNAARRRKKARADALKRRQGLSIILAAEIRKLEAAEARDT